MNRRSRRIPRVLAGVVVVVVLLLVVLQTASKRPSSVVKLTQDHEERGRALGLIKPDSNFVPPPPPANYTPSAETLEKRPVLSGLAPFWMTLTAARLERAGGPPTAEALEQLQEAFRTSYSAEAASSIHQDVPESDWKCLAPMVDHVLASFDQQWQFGLLPWAAARAFKDGDDERGMEMVRLGATKFLQLNGMLFSEAEKYGFQPWGYPEGLLAPDFDRGLIGMLLILDATNAPREAIAEVLRMTLEPEDPTVAEERGWLIERNSLGFQEMIAQEARRQNERFVSDSVALSAAQWLGYLALRPVLISKSEDFLAAWRAHDGVRMASAEAAMTRTARAMFVDTQMPSETYRRIGRWAEARLSADEWQYRADCFGGGNRPGSLEMARFVAAAMLFRRDTGVWPTALDEIVPGYLPAGAIDAESTWGVVEVPATTAISRMPPDPEFDSLLEGWYSQAMTPPQSLDDLRFLARPGDDLARFAGRFVALPARPIFYRSGPASRCSLAMMAALDTGAAPNPKPRAASDSVALLSGKQKLCVLETTGWNQVPAPGLLKLLRRETGS